MSIYPKMRMPNRTQLHAIHFDNVASVTAALVSLHSVRRKIWDVVPTCRFCLCLVKHVQCTLA
jgi:hypothetical protein